MASIGDERRSCDEMRNILVLTPIEPKACSACTGAFRGRLYQSNCFPLCWASPAPLMLSVQQIAVFMKHIGDTYPPLLNSLQA